MPRYSFILTEYDLDEPWIIVSTGRDSVELAEGEDFQEWVRTRWPSPRFKVQRDPQSVW